MCIVHRERYNLCVLDYIYLNDIYCNVQSSEPALWNWEFGQHPSTAYVVRSPLKSSLKQNPIKCFVFDGHSIQLLSNPNWSGKVCRVSVPVSWTWEGQKKRVTVKGGKKKKLIRQDDSCNVFILDARLFRSSVLCVERIRLSTLHGQVDGLSSVPIPRLNRWASAIETGTEKDVRKDMWQGETLWRQLGSMGL